MWIAVGIIGIVLAVAGIALFVLAMRRLALGCIRQYQLGGDNSVNFQANGNLTPRCACYMTSARGLSEPRLVRGRLCEMNYLNTGQWPEWCRGPKV